MRQNILGGYEFYCHKLSDYTPLMEWTTLGYCIANSTYRWRLQLGDGYQHMQSTAGLHLLLQALQCQSSPHYTIDSLECFHEDNECRQQLLSALPLQSMEILKLSSETIQPLPPCLSKLCPTLKRLHTLHLCRATAETLTVTLQALAATPTTLKVLDLGLSQFSLQVMQDLYSLLLSHSRSMTTLCLSSCKILDEEACLLATVLQRLERLEQLHLDNNHIHDSTMLAIVNGLVGLTELRVLNLSNNPISAGGHETLEISKQIKKSRWSLT